MKGSGLIQVCVSDLSITDSRQRGKRVEGGEGTQLIIFRFL